MSPLTKSAIALGTIGGLGGVSYVVKQQLTTEDTVLDIGVELIKEGYEILDSNSGEWVEILKSYKEGITTNEKLKFGNFDGSGEISELKRLCSEATKVNPSKNKDKDLYEKARLWCTKPRTLEDILGQKGYRFLDTETSASDEKDIEEWNKMLDEYFKKEQNENKFTEVDLVAATVSGESGAKKDKTERSKLRDKCKPLKEKKHHTKDFEKELKKGELWCAIKLPK